MNIRKVKLKDLKPVKYNPRKELKPGDKEYEDLKNSISKFGYVNLIIVDEENNVIGGHQIIPVLKELGYKEIEVVSVDISENDSKILNIALNKIHGDWDMDKLNDLLQEIKVESWDDFGLTGFDMKSFDEMVEEMEKSNNEESKSTKDMNPDEIKNYTDKIKAPVYEPKEEQKPVIDNLVNEDKAKKLLSEVDKIEDGKEKDFLKLACSRFLQFDYEKIAEYYCHSSKEIQELMEKLALVIIDFNDAIKNGLTEFADNIFDFRKGDIENGDEIQE